MARLIQPAFARGEVAPDLYGRVDTNAYQLALRTARNVMIHAFGGVSNRPGTIFIGPVKDHTRFTRIIPFQFKTTDTHLIELGHQYIRFLRNDAHITETGVNITAATQANPVQITTSAPHGFSTGDEVFISGVGGMTQITEERWKITVTGASTFTLQDQVDGTNVDGTTFTAYTSGGTAARIYTITSPYQEADLRNIKYSQSADVMTLTHPSYEPRELSRFALTNWTLTPLSFAPDQAAPSAVAVTASPTGAVTVRYKVTAISKDNDEESLPGLSSAAALVITGATKANPCVITRVAHGLYSGAEIEITGVVGMTELNGRRYRVTVLTADTFQLRDVDSTNFTTYTSGGSVNKAYAVVTNSTTNFPNTVTWTGVANARTYAVYREENGIFGLVGETEGLSFLDASTITANLTEGPPQERNPFFGANNYPGAVGSHEQRRVLGGSNNQPDTSFYSKTGVRDNFNVGVPSRDDDAITATLPSGEVNQIRHYLSIGDLLVFTSGAEWRVLGSSDTGFTAATIQQKFQSNWGSSQLPPLAVGSTALFVLENGTAMRSLGFSQELGGFTSKNLSLLIPHLLRDRMLLEWGYTRKPDPLIFIVRDDGQLLQLAFEEEQEVVAWSHWDTSGFYESTAVIRPSASSLFDAAYFVVQRKLNGRIVRMIERTHSRQFTDVRDAFFVDCGLTFDEPLLISAITAANPVVVTSTAHGLANGDQVDLSDILWVSNFDAFGNETQPAQLNGGRFVVASATANTFALTSLENGSNINGTAFNTYVSGGVARKAVISISGLRHLTNEFVSILADGNVLPKQQVATHGILNLSRRYSRLHIGLSYTSDIETLNVETQPRTTQGAMKKISQVTVRFARSRGLLIGSDTDNLVEMKQREFEALGEPTALLTGDKLIKLLPEWNTDGRLFLRQKDPLPMTILAIVPEVEFEDA